MQDLASPLLGNLVTFTSSLNSSKRQIAFCLVSNSLVSYYQSGTEVSAHVKGGYGGTHSLSPFSERLVTEETEEDT
jgi:hypothetical protein